jgi:hypothetical protein
MMVMPWGSVGLRGGDEVGVIVNDQGRRWTSGALKSGPTVFCCTHWAAPGQNIGIASGGGTTPMARAPIAIVATAVTLTATVPNAACSRRPGVERPVLAVFMVILRLFWLVVLSSPPEDESSWGGPQVRRGGQLRVRKDGGPSPYQNGTSNCWVLAGW